MSELEAFRHEVETFLRTYNWSPTRFGRAAAKDQMFVFQLRTGREPRSGVRHRVRSFMEQAASDEVAA
ncbi:hypothetical protein ASG54_22585 [Aureimonas sp. Leaf460]|nr:hypothetical protein ASG62_16475 [Aureimonas sp. Leaf427]KQT65745.1 hypothetical protein ASG54_22585 [Aureimonas sp. Leaf460]